MSSIVEHAPRFTSRDACRLAAELFGIEAEARLLPSERDQNFHLTAADGQAYVLKLANSAETREVLDFQNRAMTHVARQLPGACPQVQLTSAGESIATVAAADGSAHWVRVLTYLPGKPLGDVKPHDDGLLTSLGHFYGHIGKALADFDHPAVHRDFHWDLQHAGRVVDELVGYIPDAARRELVGRLRARFQSATEARLEDLRLSVIHNDGNDYNVLVGPADGLYHRVSGIIDFGDMVFSYTAAEPAVACAYAMLHKADPLTAASLVVAGYHGVYPLTEPEIAVLFDLICMRLCMSVCHAAHQSRAEPDNAYLRISERQAWTLLQQLNGVHPRWAHYVFRRACGLPPVPQTPRIVRWLHENAPNFKSPVAVDLTVPGQLVFDLSPGGDLMNAGAGPDAMAALDAAMGRQMAAAGVDAAVGAYDEARLLYTTEAYAVAADNRRECRSIHLGLDLYMAAGSAVMAFMDGRVHSLADNAAALDYGPTIVLEHVTGGGDRFFSLYGHLSRSSLAGLAPGDAIAAGQTFARTGQMSENGGWPPHLHFQLITDMLAHSGTFDGVAAPGQRTVWTAICPDPNLVLGIPVECFPPQGRTRDEILGLRHNHLGRSLSIAYRRPLKIVRGRGQYLFSDDGQIYLDGVNNVCHVGHCHPAVVAAGQRQMAVLNTNTRYLHDHIVEYAQRLLATFPDPLNVCFFVCTGSEANELALRLARTVTAREEIIAVAGAYHGNTQGLVDISSYKHDGPGGKGAPGWVRKVVMPDGYRGPYKGNTAAIGTRYARHVETAVADLCAKGPGPAAFICESMLGCGGQLILPAGYLAESFRHVRAGGGVCIVDEVQVGFGRAGSCFWAFETQAVVPDIVTLGKPMGNGHPLAAVITTRKIADAFANGMEYFNTFGGNPVSCAIGMAVLDVIETENLQRNAQQTGHRLLAGLQELQTRYPIIGDVRGLGLYTGVELVTDRDTLAPAAAQAAYITDRLRDLGILMSTDGPLHNVLKLKPPLVFDAQNADQVVAALDEVLQDDCLQVSGPQLKEQI